MLIFFALVLIALFSFCLLWVFVSTRGRSVAALLQNRSSQTAHDVSNVIDEEGSREAIDMPITYPAPFTSRAHAQIDYNAGLTNHVPSTSRAHAQIDYNAGLTNPVPSTSHAHAQIDCTAGLLGILNRLERLSETVESMRTYQFSLLTTQKLNEWDITHCHPAIFLHDELFAEHSSQQKYFVSVRALVPARCTFGIFYFEITVLTMKSDFGIGLAPHWMGMHEIVGHTEHSFAYWSDGTIHGCCDSLPNPLDGFTQFGEADTVGCGIDLLTRAIFFTMNGTRIETGYLYADTVHMFACCTLVDYEDRIQANFGPHFMYNLSSLVPF